MAVCGRDTSLPSVPRSKGCLTCVTRKSRCDGRKPTCQACEDRKQICRGYRRDKFVFLNEGWRAPGVSKAGRNKPAEPKKKHPTEANQFEANLPGTRALAGPDIRCMDVSPQLHRSLSTDRTQLSAAFFMTEFASTFITTPHFMASLFRPYLSPHSSNRIASDNSNVSFSAPTILAVDALARGHFGIAKGDPLSVQQSFYKYGQALNSMSSFISALGLESFALDSLSDDDWQHFAFFCVVMTFWELKMCPRSTNWQSHVRALSNAIALRGEGRPFSRTNRRLIATSRLMIGLESLSSRQLGSLTPYEWRKRTTIRSAWLTEAKTTIYTSEDLIPSWGNDIYYFLDSLMDALPALASLIGRYEQLVVKILETGASDDCHLSQALLSLYHEAKNLLRQTELSGSLWENMIQEVSIEQCRSKSNDGEDRREDYSQFWHTFERELDSLFDSVLYFRSIHEYQAFTLYWTVVISLHLQLRDMLSLMMATGVGSIVLEAEREIIQHRSQLIRYVENVLRAISFAEDIANRRLAPFFITTAFQMTTVVLERECEILRAGNGDPETIQRYDAMKALAWRYMKWAFKSKIPIKLDMTG